MINALSAKIGGGQTYLKNLLAHIPPDLRVQIAVLAPPTLWLPIDPRITRLQTRWPTRNPIMRAMWESLFLPSILKRMNTQIFFAPGGLLLSSVPDGCRTVTMFRNMLPFDDKLASSIPGFAQRCRNTYLRHQLLRSMIKADLTIFISEYARERIFALCSPKNSITIPHGVSSIFRGVDPIASRPLALPHRFLLYVSRFEHYKCHLEVVTAYATLPAEIRAAVKLVLIGETDYSAAEEVVAKVAALGLSEDVRILGAIPYETLPAYYAASDAVIFASACENCPNILLEAMASGKPVLSSNIQPMPEFGGPDLQYFDPHNPDDIARAIMEILGSRELADRVAKAALERSASYNWAITATKTWAALTQLVNSG